MEEKIFFRNFEKLVIRNIILLFIADAVIMLLDSFKILNNGLLFIILILLSMIIFIGYMIILIRKERSITKAILYGDEEANKHSVARITIEMLIERVKAQGFEVINLADLYFCIHPQGDSILFCRSADSFNQLSNEDMEVLTEFVSRCSKIYKIDLNKVSVSLTCFIDDVLDDSIKEKALKGIDKNLFFKCYIAYEISTSTLYYAAGIEEISKVRKYCYLSQVPHYVKNMFL